MQMETQTETEIDSQGQKWTARKTRDCCEKDEILMRRNKTSKSKRREFNEIMTHKF